jgi:hypothetical protein
MALDLLSLDIAFEGLPFDDTGPAESTSLDLAFEGLPFTPLGPAVIDATVATSQAQHVLSAAPLATSVATSQAQAGSAAAMGSWVVSASSSQAQGASAAATVANPWALLRRDITELNIGYTAADGFSDVMAASEVIAGNHILLAVQHDVVASATVTDTAGNTYVATTEIGFTDHYAHLRWFYCLNAIGHPSNVITVNWSADVSGGGRALTALHVQSPGPAAFDIVVQSVTNTASTSIFAGPFNTAGPGFIAAAVVSVSYDTAATWINGMAFTAPRTTYFYGTGTLITSVAQIATNVGITGTTVNSRRLLSAVSIVEADPGIRVGTKQGQTSNAAAALSGGASTVSVASAQAQSSAASAASAAAGQSASAQAQQAAAFATLACDGAASTAQAQAASVQAALFQPASSGTAQAQASSAQAGLASDTSTSAAQAQTTGAGAELSLDANAQLAQAQGSSGQLDAAGDASVATASVQQVAAIADSAYVLDVATAQEQQADAQAQVSSATQAGTAQEQGSSADAEVGADAVAATYQSQRVRAQVRGESVNTIESGQRQHAVGQLGLSSDGPAATRQGQQAALLAGVASDVLLATGQAEHIGDGNRLLVGIDVSVTTAQAAQHAKGALAQYTAQPGALSLATMRLHLALAGSAQAQPALQAPTRMRTALGGRVDLRPDR